VNAGSTASFVGYPFGLAYGASKGGVAILTKNLAVALATHGIRVNAYCPASTDTNMVATVSKVIGESGLGVPANPNAAQLGAHLVRRIGDPRDVAELVCFMASERASFVNGVTWLIDGGTLAWRDTVDALGMS
jgi:NAD(P)-dependent dehydrogenase (short-subunit alcohol dehydrogenase family)